jgi:hypothetical protein
MKVWILLPSVLVPGFDLCVSQVELCSQLHSVLNAQVLLTLEAALQCLELVIGESGPTIWREIIYLKKQLRRILSLIT